MQTPSTSFREIHELNTSAGRVVLFEIPAAPRGLPIAWQTHFYARNGSSLTGLSIAKQDEIRAQGLADDWSAIVVKQATMADLDSDALAKARAIFTAKYTGRIPAKTIQGWSDAEFLGHAHVNDGNACESHAQSESCQSPCFGKSLHDYKIRIFSKLRNKCFLFGIINISFINYYQAVEIIQYNLYIISIDAIACWIIG